MHEETTNNKKNTEEKYLKTMKDENENVKENI